jgi:hypothetical protein
MIGLVRQKDGMHLRYLCHLSPMICVVSIQRMIKVAMAPIPATTKCKNMVTVYATESLVNKKEEA